MITVCYLFWYSRQNVFLVSYCKYSATRAFLHAWLVTFLLCALCIQLVVGKDVRYRFCYVCTSLKVIPGATEELLYVTTFFLYADSRISLNMPFYVGGEGTTVEVCAVLSNVFPVDGTPSDISTTFMLTDGDAGKKTLN